MYVYSTSFIDFWDGWRRPSDVFKVPDRYHGKHPTLYPTYEGYLTPDLWETTWERAKTAAKSIGWEGDIREGPYVSMCPVPDYEEDVYDNDGYFFIAWKQDNNGITFIASPVPLAYLLNNELTRCAYVPRRKRERV